MARFLTLCLALLTAIPALGQTNRLAGQVGDYGLAPGDTNTTVTLTLIQPPWPRVVNGVAVRRDPMQTHPDTNGQFFFTNIIWGKYQMDVSGRYGSPFTVVVTTNTLGTVALGSLIYPPGTVYVPPPNPASNYYTMAQSDATTALLRAEIAASGGTNGGGKTTNASDLTTGTLPLERLPSAVLTNTQSGVTLSGTVNALTNWTTGDGVVHYQVDADSDSGFCYEPSGHNWQFTNGLWGTLAFSDAGGAFVLGTNGGGYFAGALTANRFYGTLHGSVEGTATGLNGPIANGSLNTDFNGNNKAITNVASVTAGTFTGNGAGVTNLLLSSVNRVFYVCSNLNAVGAINDSTKPFAPDFTTNGVLYLTATNWGDTIRLYPGTYTNAQVFLRSGIVFEGMTSNVLFYTTNYGLPGLFQCGDGCVIRNLSWNGAYDVEGGDGTHYRHIYGTLVNPITNSLVTFENCNMHGGSDVFLPVQGVPLTVIIKHCNITSEWDIVVNGYNFISVQNTWAGKTGSATVRGARIDSYSFVDMGSTFNGFADEYVFGSTRHLSLNGSILNVNSATPVLYPQKASGSYRDATNGVHYLGAAQAGWASQLVYSNMPNLTNIIVSGATPAAANGRYSLVSTDGDFDYGYARWLNTTNTYLIVMNAPEFTQGSTPGYGIAITDPSTNVLYFYDDAACSTLLNMVNSSLWTFTPAFTNASLATCVVKLGDLRTSDVVTNTVASVFNGGLFSPVDGMVSLRSPLLISTNTWGNIPPQPIKPGDALIANSNGVLHVITSLPGTPAWAATNKWLP